MNKEKLVGLLAKKQTYKETKPIQADILRNKQQAVNVSIGAIHQILKDDYNVEAKLYAVRYLKDCFEKGSDLFIAKSEQKLLPILVKMVKDSQDETAIMRYGGSYTKNDDLQKFKSLVTSLFTMSRECIEKWATWIPDPSRGFAKAWKQVQHVPRIDGQNKFVYFRDENQGIFMENCSKNGLKLAPKGDKIQKQNRTSTVKIVQQQKPLNSSTQPQQNLKKMAQPIPVVQPRYKYKAMGKIATILRQTSDKISSQQYYTAKQLTETQAKFNAAVNQYIEEASEFDQHFLESKIQEFQKAKEINKKGGAGNRNEGKQQSKISSKDEESLTVKQKQKQVYKQQKVAQKQKQVHSNSSINEKKLAQNRNPSFNNVGSDKSMINSNSQLQEKQSAGNTMKVEEKEKSMMGRKLSQQVEPPEIKIIPAPTQNSHKSAVKGKQQLSQPQPVPRTTTPKSQPIGVKQQQRVNFQQSEEQESQYSLSSQLKSKQQYNDKEKISLLHKNNNNISQVASRVERGQQKKKIETQINEQRQKEKEKEIEAVESKNRTTAKFLSQEQFTPIKMQTDEYKMPGPIPGPGKNMKLSLSNRLNPEYRKVQEPIESTALPAQQQIVVKPSFVLAQAQFQQYGTNGPNTQPEIDKLTKKYQQETVQLYGKIQNLQREMMELRDKEIKLKEGVKNTVDLREIDGLRKRLEKQQQDKYEMGEEIKQLKAGLQKMKGEFERSKEQWRNAHSRTISEITPNQTVDNYAERPPSHINTSKQSVYKMKKINHNSSRLNQHELQNQEKSQSRVRPSVLPVEAPVIVKQFSPRVDEDYINGMTSYQKISSWLNQKNQLSFKLCILGLGQQFYSDQNVKIYQISHKFTQNGAEFLKLTFSFHFRRLQQRVPRTAYKNIAEVDFWTKPCTGSNEVYSQETIARLCMVPIKVMKGTVYCEQNRSSSFLLPFILYSYLQPVEFDGDQFEQAMAQRHQQALKSRVVVLNNAICPTAVDMQKIFKNSVLSNQYLEMCLQESAEDRVFLVQIELLRNQKAVIRVLPIPCDNDMVGKGRELVNDLVFLLSQ